MIGRLFTFGAVLAVAAPVLAADTPTPTFAKDIAPIFQAKCQECHQPNSIAPMSLITFQEARPWARSIKQRVAHAADAAVAHRPQRRRPEVQERHVADATSRSTRSCAGSMPARRRAIRRTCRRPSR